MRLRGTLLLLMIAPMLLAGCLGGQDETGDAASGTDPAAGGDGALDEAASLAAPSWTVGQWWTWKSPQLGTYSYIVTEDAGADWIVDTDSEEVAFFDAQTDISFLGEVRKEDLAGSQGETRVEFFDWPLEPGKTWTTRWDGVERTVEVVAIEDGVVDLEARQDGRLAVTYQYVQEAEGFGDVTFYDENETETFSVVLQDWGENATQVPVRWQLETVADGSGTIGVQPVPWGGQFEVAEGTTDMHLSFQVTCPSGSLRLGISPAEDGFAETSDEGYGIQANCPYEEAFQRVILEEPTPGEWSASMQATSPAGEGAYDVTLLLRTLETVEIQG